MGYWTRLEPGGAAHIRFIIVLWFVCRPEGRPPATGLAASNQDFVFNSGALTLAQVKEACLESKASDKLMTLFPPDGPTKKYNHFLDATGSFREDIDFSEYNIDTKDFVEKGALQDHASNIFAHYAIVGKYLDQERAICMV